MQQAGEDTLQGQEGTACQVDDRKGCLGYSPAPKLFLWHSNLNVCLGSIYIFLLSKCLFSDCCSLCHRIKVVWGVSHTFLLRNSLIVQCIFLKKYKTKLLLGPGPGASFPLVFSLCSGNKDSFSVYLSFSLKVLT